MKYSESRYTSFPVKDETGQLVKGWQFKSFRNAWNCGGNLPHNGKFISGWILQSPDGVERVSEGNWLHFVPFAQLVISNYGCTSTLS